MIFFHVRQRTGLYGQDRCHCDAHRFNHWSKKNALSALSEQGINTRFRARGDEKPKSIPWLTLRLMSEDENHITAVRRIT
jgi:hypothetical protein